MTARTVCTLTRVCNLQGQLAADRLAETLYDIAFCYMQHYSVNWVHECMHYMHTCSAGALVRCHTSSLHSLHTTGHKIYRRTQETLLVLVGV